MYMISLDWRRPSDGVEVVPANTLLPDILGDAQLVRAKTDRKSLIPFRVKSLEDPMALRLVNARNIDALASFTSRFGMPAPPDYKADREWMLVPLLESLREELEEGLQLTNADEDSGRALWAERYLRNVSFYPAFEHSEDAKRQKLVFKPSSLADLMFCEVAFALEAGAKLRHCEHCGSVFLTGHLTGRRASAVYCSDRCRVAALRAKNSASAKPKR
ncbi:hypothetical protein PYH37_002831 [Sinorhizobium numidicum]|uniref:Zinc finger CGNR domain-containing protein n=1 Tax=Sinorhizobium numidicum TaxID=680248 RepID=A0ABY8D183_9HYPH|nr:hypothetical protein [Sinorhizobium numidicum]WEX77987.1 hypothetical protein PYH37_002831 [Sinorhizobium numidicum]WEX84646.1 hypothetical protein PYH38_003544 [Sinorhizobium numidicum]